MAGFCKVILMGNVGRDPELRYTANGKAVLNLSVATSTKKQGEEVTLWHRVTMYDKLAEIASQHLRKGRQVCIEGRLNYSSFKDKNGIERPQTEIIATDLHLIGGNREERPAEKLPEDRPAEKPVEEDLPF